MNTFNFWAYFGTLIFGLMFFCVAGGAREELGENSGNFGYAATVCVLLLIILVKYK